ncbi:hypothetical protein ROA7023_04321 [Roseisalinus antarcticus]|uniref:Uncharacterized protein n=1 Tax=Roseisalinus antarcticus TaxID=254357 RepID=A0A1Y5U2L6_9RHOB|nr:hypothetical protein ROA7023_04321 [Roseisalinus antarcticus]
MPLVILSGTLELVRVSLRQLMGFGLPGGIGTISVSG